MPTLHTLLAFFGLSLLLAISPGPDNIFVLMQSMQRGWRMGLAVVLGLCLGILGHTAAVALGLAAVVAASATLFSLIKWCGAAYLLYLAWGAWRAPAGGLVPHAPHSAAPAPWSALLRMVGRGVLMNATNPKVLMFFLALLPQFADPARGNMGGQIVMLGGVFMLASLLVFGAIALFSGWFGRLLQGSARAQHMLNRLASLVFVGLAVRLATVQR